MEYYNSLKATLPQSLLRDYDEQIKSMCFSMERNGHRYMFGGSFRCNLEILLHNIRTAFPAYAEKYNF